MSGPVFGATLTSGIERLLADLRASIEGTRPGNILDDLFGGTTTVDTDDVPTQPNTPVSDLIDVIAPDGILPVQPAVEATPSSFIDDIIADMLDSVFEPGEPAPVVTPTDVTSIFDLFGDLPAEFSDLIAELGLVGPKTDTAPTDADPIGDLLELIGADSDEFVFKGSTGADIVAGLTGSASSGPDLPTGEPTFPFDLAIDGAALASLDGQSSFWDDFVF